ncbi:MAG: tripartite tricarboxylate transporter substrate binding protein [Betaproteobacteria bacterium]|nr:tripartite tricarboxylate transporter substrate binding protein [Betaproteobacteria bacterium]
MKPYWNAVYRRLNLTLTPGGPGNTSAERYPDRPIRFIVPFAEGGPGDILARLIGQKLTASWGQPVIVENRPGAGGTIGSELGARSAPDGHTLILASSTHAINPSLYAKLPYDTVKDFQPITLMISMPNILVVNSSLPVNSLEDLITLARSKPGQLKYASGGVGTPSHLGAELLKIMTGVDIVHVLYKGHAPAGAALRKGDVSMMFDAILLALPEIRAGKVKALAVTSAKRSSVAQEVPSAAESGLPGFDFSPGVGVLVRAGTPNDIVNKLYKEIVSILHLPEIQERLTKDGAEIVGNTPEQYAAYIEQEIIKWAKVAKASGIRAQ